MTANSCAEYDRDSPATAQLRSSESNIDLFLGGGGTNSKKV